MKKISLALAALSILLLTQSCNKRCQCVGYDSSTVEYTTDELSALGKTCSDMIYYEGLATQRYSVCEWKY